VCKIWTKNSQPFGKKCQKTSGGIFLTHTVYANISECMHTVSRQETKRNTHCDTFTQKGLSLQYTSDNKHNLKTMI